jgi:integrase
MGRQAGPGIYFAAGGSCSIDKWHNGHRIRARLGKVTIAEAEAYIRRTIAELEAAEGRSPRKTFREAGIRYLTDKQHKRSINTDAYHIELLDPWLGALPLNEIHNDAPQLLAFRKHRVEVDKVTPTTIKRSIEVLRCVLNLAARKWRTEANRPWLEQAPPLFDMPKNPHARAPYPLAMDEQRLLFSWLPKYLAEMALFKANTGTREAEVCGLRWEWEQKVPELATSVFVVPAGIVKNGEDRVVVLNETAKAIVDARRGKHAVYVFGPVARMNNTAWQRARREAAAVYEEQLGRPCPPTFARVRVHDLKHTCGRRLRSAGVPLETRKTLLGHRTGDITTHYSVAEIGELLAAANRICAIKGTPAVTMLRAVGA